LTPLFEGNPLTQGKKFCHKKITVLVVAHSGVIVILACAVLIQIKSVMDGQTDRWTDTWTTAKTCEALHAVARKKLRYH